MLKIEFLNVGKGNCTLITFPSGRFTIVDIDNSRVNGDNRLTDPIEFLKKHHFGIPPFRFILTHPDMDHLSGLEQLINYQMPTNFWDTNNNKSITDSDWNSSPYNKGDWDTYQSIRSKKFGLTYNCFRRGDRPDCCFVQDNIEILSPNEELEQLANESKEYNHISYVLLIRFAGRKIILGGDASTDVWENILSHYGKEYLKSDIFLAPHHGSENNIHDEAFKAIAPSYVIVSVVSKVDYAYDYYNKLASSLVLSTKYYGNITVEVKDNGEYLPITVERDAK